MFPKGKGLFQTRDIDTVAFYFEAYLGERQGVVFVIRLDFRSTDFTFRDTFFPIFYVVKELFVSQVDTFGNLLDDLTRQLIPVGFCPLFQLRDMTAYPSKRRIFPIDTIVTALQLQEVHMHTMQVVYQIANLYQVRLMVELIFFRFHGLSRITSLTPAKWVGPTHCQATMLCMSVQRDTLIIAF